MSYRIIAATSADIPALVALLGSLFEIEQDFSPDGERQRRGLELLLARPGQACLLVAHDAAGNPVGMISAQLVASTAEGALSAWVEDVVVAAAHRGGGLGSSLLEGALAWARERGATRAQLLADRNNLPAHRFYERKGWRRTQLDAWRLTLD